MVLWKVRSEKAAEFAQVDGFLTMTRHLRICRKCKPELILREKHAEAPAQAVSWKHFMDEVIVLCVRWYLRYSLSYRDLEEIMAERRVGVDHSTIGRWVLRYAPVLNERLRRHLRRPGASWRVDETYIRVKDVWTYLYRAIDSTGDTLISYYR